VSVVQNRLRVHAAGSSLSGLAPYLRLAEKTAVGFHGDW
jgi:hypothetical protein